MINKLLLPGKDAHIRLAPHQRRADMSLDIPPPSDARESAVLLLLIPDIACSWKVLIILRNTYNGIHSAQPALPGGKRDLTDSSLYETALREAREEMGILPNQVETIGFLTKLYVPPSNFIIYPLLAISRQEIHYKPDPREVVRYTTIPINLLNPDLAITKHFQSPTGEWLTAPGYDYDNLFIWGATAMILSELYHISEQGHLNSLL